MVTQEETIQRDPTREHTLMNTAILEQSSLSVITITFLHPSSHNHGIPPPIVVATFQSLRLELRS